MHKIFHICVDPARVATDRTYTVKHGINKPRSDTDRTEADKAVDRIIPMIHAFNKLGIPTYFTYLEYDFPGATIQGVDKSGGGIHPKLAKAFPNYKEWSEPKWHQSALRDMALPKRIGEVSDGDIMIGSGFLRAECFKDTMTDYNYPMNRAKLQKWAVWDCTADMDGETPADVTKGILKRNGVLIKDAKTVTEAVHRLHATGQLSP